MAGWLFATSSAAGCGAPGEPEPITVRGVLVDVLASSLTSLQSLDLRAEDGRRLSFRVEGDIGFSPGHMREHMVLGEPVTVTYRESDGRLVALRVED